LRVADNDVLHFDRKQSALFRGSNIGFIFQDFNLIPVLTVYENIEYPLLMVQNVPAAERKKRVSTVIEAVGMVDQKDKYPDQISGDRNKGLRLRGHWLQIQSLFLQMSRQRI
jgi:ABC-type antimicrobial peptide transport system, ATPase component